MPDQTDRLTTIIEMLGAAQSAQQLLGIKVAADTASRSLLALVTHSEGVGSALRGLQSLFMLGTAGLGGIAAGALLAVSAFGRLKETVVAGMREWDRYNQALTRALLLSSSAGLSVSAAGLAGLASRRRAALGIPEERTLGLAGQMAERGFGGARIGTLLPMLQEIEEGTAGRVSSERAMEMFLRVLQRPMQAGRGGGGGGGGGRGLMQIGARLGITMRFTGDTQRDLNKLTEAIHEKFGGVSEALARTSSGVHLRFQEDLTAALGRLGAIAEISLVPAMLTLSFALNAFSGFVDIALGRGGTPSQQAAGGGALIGLAGAVGGPVGAGLFSAILAAQKSADAELARSGGRQEDLLGKIATNTAQMAGAMSQILFGHASAFTQGAFSFSELNRAISFHT